MRAPLSSWREARGPRRASRSSACWRRPGGGPASLAASWPGRPTASRGSPSPHCGSRRAPARPGRPSSSCPSPRSHPDVVGLGQPGTADILEVEPGLASAHATSSNGQVAATPALTRRTAARRTAIKAKLRGSRLLLPSPPRRRRGPRPMAGSRPPRPLSLAGQAEAAGLVIGLDDYPIGPHPDQPHPPLPADRAAPCPRPPPPHRK
jgi:hypothetical protein